MPIYAYKCSSCGHAEDVLQKVSDAPPKSCPQCGAETYSKQLTAAGFQLRGSGWYATDFKNGSSARDGKTGAKPTESNDAAKSEKVSTGDAAKSEKASASSETTAGSACGQGGCAACS
jgi:putative FmdB family regulatory protein